MLARATDDEAESSRLLGKAVARGVCFSVADIHALANCCTKPVLNELVLRMPGPFTQADLESLWEVVSHSVLQQLAAKNQVTLWATPAQLDWQTYQAQFHRIPAKLRAQRIDALTSFGSAYEVVLLASRFPRQETSSRLVEKAMAHGVTFSAMQMLQLAQHCTPATLNKLLTTTQTPFTQAQLETLCGFAQEDILQTLAHKNRVQLWAPVPHLEWNRYYENFEHMPAPARSQRIEALTSIGPVWEVVHAVRQIEDAPTASRLVGKAVAHGVHFSPADIATVAPCCTPATVNELLRHAKEPFTQQDLDKLFGYADECLLQEIAAQHQLIMPEWDEEEDVYELPQKKARAPYDSSGAFLGLVAGSLLLEALTPAPRHPKRCTGDCAHCPDHYGVRYGRWYYGRGHVAECEFGGNKGDGSLP